MRQLLLPISVLFSIFGLFLLLTFAQTTCPSNMAFTGVSCIDRYEASLKGWPYTDNPGEQTIPAVSVPGIYPQVNIDQIQAARACSAAGKRLCSDTEWLRACQGPDSFTYPYGDTWQQEACNGGEVNPSATLNVTGACPGCLTVEGVFDMVGNVGEWTSDPHGTFRGGYFGDAVLNGPGCLYVTTAHDASHWDAKTGFRCCAGADSFNFLPVANAGPDQTVNLGVAVTLDGSGSSDPGEYYPLTYSWEITSKPDGSNSVLTNANTINPSIIPDVRGNYYIQLTVTNTVGASGGPDTVVVSTTNTAPVAEAGPDQSVLIVGSTISLNGTASYDADGDAFTYLWTISQQPVNSTTSLSDPTSPVPTFVADVHGDYIISLVVKDVFDAVSVADTVTISFTNVRPVANAGGNQSSTVGGTVILDGSASSDANHDPLTYQWSMVSKPAGSAAVLVPAPTPDAPAVATLVVDKVGDYIISLTVSDGVLASDPNNVTVTAISSQNQAIDILNRTITMINGLSSGNFKNPNMRDTLTKKINVLLRLIDQGLYADALDKLENDTLQKVDGCAIAGAPDKNDWITNCAAQGQVYSSMMEADGRLRQ